MTNHNMYDWVFHFNTYTGKWCGAKREHYNDLFNNASSDNIICSKSIHTLHELVNRTNGNKVKINKLVKK